jgi:hypothetical protein
MSGYEYEIKNPKKDPALYEDRGGNIIPAQFSEHPHFRLIRQKKQKNKF